MFMQRTTTLTEVCVDMAAPISTSACGAELALASFV